MRSRSAAVNFRPLTVAMTVSGVISSSSGSFCWLVWAHTDAAIRRNTGGILRMRGNFHFTSAPGTVAYRIRNLYRLFGLDGRVYDAKPDCGLPYFRAFAGSSSRD